MMIRIKQFGVVVGISAALCTTMFATDKGNEAEEHKLCENFDKFIFPMCETIGNHPATRMRVIPMLVPCYEFHNKCQLYSEMSKSNAQARDRLKERENQLENTYEHPKRHSSNDKERKQDEK